MSIGVVDPSSHMTLPAVPDTFYWTDEPWGPALRCRPLSAVAPHAFTSRHLAVVAQPRARRSSPRQWARLLVAQVSAGARPGRRRRAPGRGAVAAHAWPRGRRPTCWCRATGHGGGCARGRLRAAADGDDPVTGAVAAVHAGWRGTSAGAAVAAVDAMAAWHGTRPDDLVVAIGPCIGSCCYEVGTRAGGRVRSRRPRALPHRSLVPGPAAAAGVPRSASALRLDLAGANRDQLILAGVDETRIYTCGLCTAMHPAVLTSYRAEGRRSGRPESSWLRGFAR